MTLVNKIKQFLNKYTRCFEKVIFPLVLLLWPLVKVNQGIDVSDSTYSLGNYLYTDGIQLMWKLSTYLSNWIGSLLIRLPGGKNLVFANIYTGLILSAIALVVYFVLKDEIGIIPAFVGEFMAISFCWIPTGILYNYLSYLLFSIGALLIYLSFKKNNCYLQFVAGLVLGLNVFVRIPNLTEASLIVLVWYMVAIRYKNGDTTNKMFGSNGQANSLIGVEARLTLICLAGYIIGMIIPVTAIIIKYGFSGILEMFSGLTGIQSTDATYGPLEMIMSTIRAYIRSAKWASVVLIVILFGMLLFSMTVKSKRIKYLRYIVYLCTIGVMIRFFWGRGMFSFRYYEDYTSMFEWGMLILILAWIFSVIVLISKKYSDSEKALAVIVLVMLVITPLGSNNFTCQNLNNMFIVMPFVIYMTGRLISGAIDIEAMGFMSKVHKASPAWISMLIVVIMVTFVQTSLFHMNFVFRDGMDGSPRNQKIQDESTEAINGIKTNSENANNLIGLCEYIANDDGLSSGIEGTKGAIFWGDCPGLSYVLRLPAAISTTWPDLDSYPTDTFDRELKELYLSDESDNTAVIIRKLDVPSGVNGVNKQDLLYDYITTKKMVITYENDEYLVYR